MSRHDLSSWQSQAACRDMGVDLFFGPDSERGEGRETQDAKKRRESRAKSICRRCPVQVKCLDYAIEGPQKYGVWGGMSEEERSSERRRRQRKALKEAAA